MKTKLPLIILFFLLCEITVAQTWSGSTPGNIYYNQGNVGIGTTNLASTLAIHQNSNSSNYLRATNSITGEGSANGTLFGIDANGNSIIRNYESNSLEFYTSNVRRFFISPTGKIGIGTNNPSSVLHIASDNFQDFIILDRTSRPEIDNVFHITPSWDNDQNDQLRIIANGLNIASFEDTGNVGIGTKDPTSKLEVRGTLKTSIDGSRSISFHTNGDGNSYINYVGGNSTSRLGFQINNASAMSILNNRSVGIGTVNTGSHKLAVEGSIGAREIKVEANGWSDFVFESDYELRTLEEVEEHINSKGHLPEIPSEAEVTENGINLGEMNAKLLQKIEELTLYLIEQNKENQEQRKLIEELQKEVSALKTNKRS